MQGYINLRTNVDLAAIDGLTLRIKLLKDSVVSLNSIPGSNTTIKTLNDQLAVANIQLTKLTSSAGIAGRAIRELNTSHDDLIRKYGEFAGGRYLEKQLEGHRALIGTSALLNRSLSEQERIMRAGTSGGRVLTQSVSDAIATATGLGRKPDADMLGLVSSLKAQQGNLRSAFSGVRRAAETEGEVAGQGFFRSFFSPRFAVTSFDELMRGQRGQFTASIGAAFKRADTSGISPAFGALGGVAAVGVGVVAVEHLARSMGDLAEKTSAAAQTAGMSVKDFASLQGALILTGMKADAADATLRMFANNTEKAMANPAARAAKALHAIGIGQDEIVSKGNDTAKFLNRVIDAFGRYGSSATKAAAEEAIFGRSDENIARLLDRNSEEFQKLISKTGSYSAAVAENNAKLKETSEKLNELSLEWETLKTQLATPIEFIIKGILILPDVGAAFGKMATSFAEASTRVSKKIDEAIFSGLNKISFGLISKTPPGSKPGGIYSDVALPTVNVTDYSGLSEGYGGAPIPRGTGTVKPFDTPKGRGGAAHRAYEAFVADERNALAEARGDWAKQQQILDEWAAHAKQVFAKDPTGLEKALAAVEKASISARRELINLTIAGAAQMGRSNADVFRGFEAEMQTKVKSGGITQKQAFGFDIQEASRMEAAQKEILDKAMQQANVIGDAAAKSRIYWEEWQLGVSTQTKILELTEKIAAEGKKAADAFAAPFKKAIGEIGSDFEKTITDLLLHKGTKADIMKSLYQSLVGQGIDLVGSVASKAASGFLGGKSGDNLSTTLADFVSKQLLQIAQGATGNTFLAGIFGNTAETAAATTAGAATGAAGSIAGGGISAAGSLAGGGGGIFSWLGGLFGGGGGAAGGSSALSDFFGGVAMVAVARGGWDVPSYAGGGASIAGGLSMLHPREMVLPEDLANNVRNMTSGGSNTMHLHFHGPSDGPSVERWFNNLLARNPRAISKMFRSNSLTPNSF